MDLPDIIAALDATVVLPLDPAEWNACPGCGVQVPRDGCPAGRLCLPCSLAEVGETWPGLANRVSHHLTRNQWAKLETIADVPRLTYRAWRRRHWG